MDSATRPGIAFAAVVFLGLAASPVPCSAEGQSAPPVVAAPPADRPTGAVTGSGFPVGKIYDIDTSSEPWVFTFHVRDFVRVHDCNTDKLVQYAVVPGSTVSAANGQWLDMWTPSISVWSRLQGANHCAGVAKP
jgi:hypothetical protein